MNSSEASNNPPKFLAPTSSFNAKKVPNSEKENINKSTANKGPKGCTIPQSPKFHSKVKISNVMSKEELELKELEEMKQKEALRVQNSKKAYERLKATANVAAKTHATSRSTKQLTIPETPMHHLTKRLGVKEPAPASTKEVKKTLNFNPESGPTQPQPFKFATDARLGSAVANVSNMFRNSTGSSNGLMGSGERKAEGLSTAELIAQFQKDPRSHNVPKGSHGLTVAQAPKFETDKRLKQSHSHVLSREEKEKIEMAEFQAHPFKAKPILTGSGIVPTNAVPQKPLTEFKPFSLQTDKRAEAHRKAEPATAETGETFIFKALEMPDFKANASSNMDSPVHVKSPTIAKSPAFANGMRASAAPARRQLPHHSSVEKAKEHEHAEKAGNVRLSLTKPQPFRLMTSDRGELYKNMLQQKIQSELLSEKEAANMKFTHPVPLIVKDGSKVFVPQPSSKPVTNVEEFHLKSEAAHAEAQAKLLEKKLEEERAIRRASEFSAMPCPQMNSPNFRPYRPSEGIVEFVSPASSSTNGSETDVNNGFTMKVIQPPRPKLVPENVKLRTESRVTKRSEFDNHMKQKMQTMEEKKQLAKQLKLEKEEAEIRALRRKSVAEGGFCFKASGFPLARPISAKNFTPVDPGAEVVLEEDVSCREKENMHSSSGSVGNSGIALGMDGLFNNSTNSLHKFNANVASNKNANLSKSKAQRLSLAFGQSGDRNNGNMKIRPVTSKKLTAATAGAPLVETQVQSHSEAEPEFESRDEGTEEEMDEPQAEAEFILT